MGAPDLLTYLRDAGFAVALVGGGIRVAPAAALTDTDREAIKAHRGELLALLAPVRKEPIALSEPWTDSDAAKFVDRRDRLTRWGWPLAQSEAIADRLVRRDQEGDDRRMCVECSHLGERGRCLAAAAGRLSGTDRRHEPVPDILQRCEGFGLRKGLT